MIRFTNQLVDFIETILPFSRGTRRLIVTRRKWALCGGKHAA